MLPTVTEDPLVWAFAAITAIITTFGIVGAFVLAFRFRQYAWLPIGAGLLIRSSLDWVSRIRSDMFPVLPYYHITRYIENGKGSIPVWGISYLSDIVSVGIAIGVIIAMRSRVPNQLKDPTLASGTPGAGHQPRHP
jgi:hypothetical protein